LTALSVEIITKVSTAMTIARPGHHLRAEDIVAHRLAAWNSSIGTCL
jgi:hypothetical protein